MIVLLFSVLSSSLIFVIFRMFKRFDINTFHAVIINYLTAAALGIALFGREWNPEATQEPTWFWFVLLVAFLLISLFLLMGTSTQNNGLASTSVAVKMSMAMSLVFMIIAYDEHITTIKFIGILLAIAGVYLVAQNGGKDQRNGKSWMLAILFLGSGVLDFVLNYVQKEILSVLTPSLFTAFSLGMAGVIGSIVYLITRIKNPAPIQLKSILGGIVLGIPNFFSIYFLLMSYRSLDWTDTTVLSITNMSVVLVSALLGFFVFREARTLKKTIGLMIAILAIITLYYAN